MFHILIDQSPVNHCNHPQHVNIRNPATAHHLTLDTQLCSQLRSGTSAPMNQHFISFYLREIIQQIAKCFLFFHNLSSHLYQR